MPLEPDVCDSKFKGSLLQCSARQHITRNAGTNPFSVATHFATHICSRSTKANDWNVIIGNGLFSWVANNNSIESLSVLKNLLHAWDWWAPVREAQLWMHTRPTTSTRNMWNAAQAPNATWTGTTAACAWQAETHAIPWQLRRNKTPLATQVGRWVGVTHSTKQRP